MGRGKRRRLTHASLSHKEPFARASQLFLPELRDVAQTIEAPSHRALLQGGYVRQVGAGLYTLLPLGRRVFRKVEQVIREEMDAIGAQEMTMPLLTPRELWEKSGRASIPELFSLEDRKQSPLLLALSHEETATFHAKELSSYRELPQIWYHFALKERDEARPRGGILRLREFVMKDSYSFDRDWDGLEQSYALHREAYRRLYQRLELEVIEVDSAVGVMGGEAAHEYMAPCVSGEDDIAICAGCDYKANTEIAVSKEKPVRGEDEVASGEHCASCGVELEVVKVIEVGNIFKLGTKYSEALEATFVDEDGSEKPLVMGSYGIGPARTMAAIVEQALERAGSDNAASTAVGEKTEARWTWPQAISPYDVHLVVLSDKEGHVDTAAEALATSLTGHKIDVLLDDRDLRPGEKFHSADRIGVPLRLTIGARGLKTGTVELLRADGSRADISVDVAAEIIAGLNAG